MIWKKAVVNLLIALLATACTSSIPVHSGQNRSGQFPIVGAHAHIGASFDSAKILEEMDKNGVSKQIVMARYYTGPTGNSDLPGDDELALELVCTLGVVIGKKYFN